MFEDLASRKAMVTGGARGLGYAMADALTASGVAVTLVDMLDDVTTSAERITQVVVSPHCARGATSETRAPSRTPSPPSRRHQGPGHRRQQCRDLRRGGLSRAPAAVMRQVFDVNVIGTLHCAQALARRAAAAGRPANVINIASMSSFVVNVPQHQMPYNVSKAAVSMLTQCLAIEWLPIDVRVNAIAPGYFASDMTKQYVVKNPDIPSSSLVS